jgi:serine protease inhibitor
MRYLLPILLIFAVACDRSEFGGRKSGEVLAPSFNNFEENPDEGSEQNNVDGEPPLGVGDVSQVTQVVQEVSRRHFAELGSHRTNVIFSPYAASKKLLATAYLLEAEAQMELLEKLGTWEDVASLNAGFVDLDENLHVDPAMFFQSSIWVDESTDFQGPIGDLVQLGHVVRSVDFADVESARQQINNYYRALSEGVVSVALPSPLDRETEVGLVDVSFFEDMWTQPFDASLTAPAVFAGFETTINVPTMRTDGSFLVQRTPAYDAIILPYQGGSNLILVVPHDGSFDEVSDLVSPSFLDAVVNRAQAEFVSVRLPKVDIQLNQDERLAPGIAELYGESVLGLANHQRASLRFTETTTTATVPQDGLPNASGEPEVRNDLFEVNRPFFFAIRETNAQLVVLQGQVTDL